MYFVVSAGGTAGHINPAIAVADELRARGHRILFVGTPNHIESKLAVEAGFDFKGFEVSGFDAAKPLTLVTSGTKILKAASAAKRMFKQDRPDAVLTFGAYVSIPVGRAAASMGIPLIVHEQNSVPGMANKYLAKKADVTALTYQESAKHLSCKNEPRVIGNPVRASFETCSRTAGREYLDIPQDATVLLTFGGSLGAQHLNAAICAMKDSLLAIDNLYVIHGTGAQDNQAVLDALGLTPEQQERYKVFSYIDNMGDVLAASDLVVSRAGASSLAEIMTLGIPAVLVPFPYARGDHQTLNASGCVNAGAACLIPDAQVEGQQFSKLVLDLLQDPARRQQMAQACKQFSGSSARTALADIACNVTERSRA